MEITNWYQARKKLIRHERHLSEKDQEHGTFLLGDAEVASDVDICKAVERNLLYSKLHHAIHQLNETEQQLITFIYFQEMSIRQYALMEHIAYATAWERHKKTITKLQAAMITVGEGTESEV
ncbi:hypothetical protein [Ruminococcus sp.]|uniref:hypothetical protein n=1 Tax=Ruminococcus sp. TaxID=41978 RepID=UPI0025DF3170|nr:hypothetical protein [Ruminococcus sp.]